MRVAFQGAAGAYGELAVRRQFPDGIPTPCREFADVIEAVSAGRVAAGVLPVENSLVGAVPGVAVLLQDERIRVQSDLWVPIHHCLLGVAGAAIASVRSALSHPVALAQCQRFFAEHPHIRAVEWYDTAGAAQHVAQTADATVAAIASESAAQHYGLSVLARNLEDRADNRTRFAVFTAQPSPRHSS